MNRQKSFEHQGGVLYVVGTPIGNLGDLSPRARDVLSRVDLIAAEDTRHTRKLLSHAGISVPLISYHEHNRHTRTPELVERMEQGDQLALVSDAGMPGISDPGEELIREAVSRGIPVIPVPGPNAALTSLVGSGLPPQPFLFLGFLPRQAKERIRELERWRTTPATLVMYEAPHRILAMLKDAREVLGDRKAAVVRELTKKHEEWLRGTLSECMQWFQEHPPRGEFTVIISGQGEEKPRTGSGSPSWWESLSIPEHVEQYMERGQSRKEAIRAAAKDRGLPKREVYQAYHQERD